MSVAPDEPSSPCGTFYTAESAVACCQIDLAQQTLSANCPPRPRPAKNEETMEKKEQPFIYVNGQTNVGRNGIAANRGMHPKAQIYTVHLRRYYHYPPIHNSQQKASL